jgi:hypothetical protein
MNIESFTEQEFLETVDATNGITDPWSDNFCWFAFLEQDPSTLSYDEIEEAYELSTEWVTCACGQVCSILPKTNQGEPADPLLSDLGIKFMRRMEYATESYNDIKELRLCFNEAKSILFSIEKRSKELLDALANPIVP